MRLNGQLGVGGSARMWTLAAIVTSGAACAATPPPVRCEEVRVVERCECRGRDGDFMRGYPVTAPPPVFSK